MFSRRNFLKFLFALGLQNFFPKLAAAKDKNFFKMLVFADSQCVDYKVWKKLADFADKNFSDAEIATVIGDLVDNGTADYQWREFFSAAENLLRNRIFLPVIGNHECYNLDWKFCEPEKFLQHFNVDYFYSYDYGAASFFVLNNNFEELDEFLPDLRERQEIFFRQAVAASQKNWKIVLMHKDIYDYAQNKFNDLGKIFMPLFDELKIDLVLTGHLHTYRNRGKIFDFKKSSQGTTYILCGRAGDQKYFENISEIDEVTIPNADKIFEPETFILLECGENFLNLTCIDGEGKIFDKFTVEKFDVDT